MIHLIRSRATKQQLDEMLETLGAYVKLAVDTRVGIHNNPSMVILDPALKDRVRDIVQGLLGVV